MEIGVAPLDVGRIIVANLDRALLLVLLGDKHGDHGAINHAGLLQFVEEKGAHVRLIVMVFVLVRCQSDNTILVPTEPHLRADWVKLERPHAHAFVNIVI